MLGDGKKYVSALIVPDYDAVRKTLGMDASNEELAGDERVRGLIQNDLESATSEFAAYEQPKRFELLPRELTQEAGELTPTMKVKAQAVRERYGEVVKKLYS